MLLVWYPKCSTCQKAKKFLDDNNLSYTLRNIKEDVPTINQLKEVINKANIDINKLFNTSGLVYKSLELKDKLKSMTDNEKLNLLASNGMLIKRPILITEDFALIGFKEDKWREALINA